MNTFKPWTRLLACLLILGTLPACVMQQSNSRKVVLFPLTIYKGMFHGDAHQTSGTRECIDLLFLGSSYSGEAKHRQGSSTLEESTISYFLLLWARESQSTYFIPHDGVTSQDVAQRVEAKTNYFAWPWAADLVENAVNEGRATRKYRVNSGLSLLPVNLFLTNPWSSQVNIMMLTPTYRDNTSWSWAAMAFFKKEPKDAGPHLDGFLAHFLQLGWEKDKGVGGWTLWIPWGAEWSRWRGSS